MADETYNGWRNYGTWCLFTWLTNEEALDVQMRELAREASSDYAAGDAIKEWLEEHNPLADRADWYSDLLQWAIDRVDFSEVAAALREE